MRGASGEAEADGVRFWAAAGVLVALVTIAFGAAVEVGAPQGPVKAIGGALVSLGLWLGAVSVVVLVIIEVVRYVLHLLPVTIGVAIQLLGSGGLDLVVKFEPTELSEPSRTLLQAIASGGLSLLIDETSDGARHRWARKSER